MYSPALPSNNKKRRAKNISALFLFIATCFLVIDTMQVVMVFKTEVGMLDGLPPYIIAAAFIIYPITLFIAYILFMFGKKIKGKFDTLFLIAFLLHGLAASVLLFIVLTDLLKHL